MSHYPTPTPTPDYRAYLLEQMEKGRRATVGARSLRGLFGSGEWIAPSRPSAPSPGLGFGGRSPRRPTMPSPGLGMGTPPLTMYEDNTMGYPGGQGDPVLMMLQDLLNQRFPNGD